MVKLPKAYGVRYNIFIYYITGWWFQPTPLKNDGVKVRIDGWKFPTVSGKS
jgi:hypothetical protein